MLGNQNIVVINDTKQMSLVINARKNSAFKPEYLKAAKKGKPLLTQFKDGMSKDSPFHTQFSKVHPGTKQLLDYGENKRRIGVIENPSNMTVNE